MRTRDRSDVIPVVVGIVAMVRGDLNVNRSAVS